VNDHQHRLTLCGACDGEGVNDYDSGWCSTCGGRGYFEVCAVCEEPMGNARRKWKREQVTP
jgi:RecJ-like exonuclease